MAIDHVVVLCLENRSFDHMLGFLAHPDPSFEGLLANGPHTNPAPDGSAVAASTAAKKVLPFGPDHSHDAVMSQLAVTGSGAARRCANTGFVASYEHKGAGTARTRFGGLLGRLLRPWLKLPTAAAPAVKGRGPLVMLCQDSQQVPVLSTLAREFAVFDHWFCSVPGETWPNRNYLHAATSDGETDIQVRLYTDPTIFELLENHGGSWHIYYDDTPQVWAFRNLWDRPARHANWYPADRFAQHVAAGTLPTYSFIEPNHRPPLHTLDHLPAFGAGPDRSNSQHPENNLVSDAGYDTFDDRQDTDFARGEQLIAEIYEALRADPELFARTLLFITYDEHGGFYDHVPPPTDVPAPGDEQSRAARILHNLWHRQVRPFDFTMLGPRVPALLISPLVEAGTVVHTVHDHASVPSTLRALFAPEAQPLTRRDAWATPFHGAATRTVPRTDLPDLSGHLQPAPASAESSPPTSSAAAGATVSEGQVPGYYRDFIKQSDEVRQHLVDVGEPEIARADSTTPIQRADETAAAFSSAAHRHRHPEERPH